MASSPPGDADLMSRKLIVSASRRQDMPACATERLLEQVAAREFQWHQPYSRAPMSLRFDVAEIFCLALWSKDFGRVLQPRAREIIDPLRPCFLFTINDCPELERGLRTGLEERLAQAAEIVRHYGPERLLWRFDPIAFWSDPAGQVHHNAHGFSAVARRMAELGVQRCTFSFAQLYGKVLKRERRLKLRFVDPTHAEKVALLSRLADDAAELGIEMHGCCQPTLLACHPNVHAGRCIDGEYLSRVIDADPTGLDLTAHRSRKNCGCTRSVDVGNYRACAHRCAYCYANPSLD